MPETITYSLRADQSDSQAYYRVIPVFADEVLTYLEGQARPLLDGIQAWCKKKPGQDKRTPAIAGLELLTLGVLWNTYLPSALASRPAKRKLDAWLYLQRKKNDFLKEVSDHLRGWLGGLFPLRIGRAGSHVHYSLENLAILLDWLASTGEFTEEIRRLRLWQDYLRGLDQADRSPVLQTICQAATWFEKESLSRLGQFTPNIESFLESRHKKYRWREDNLFTGRRRVEYHLNMLAVEVLNRSLRPGFMEAGQRILIVPPCMKAKPDNECQATETPYGERCAVCTPGCRVNQVTKLGEKHGFQVFMIPDDLEKFSDDGQGGGGKAKLGLVGVSCPLTNASGGWQMQRLGVPAQGLLLDYCGCSYHWHKQGIPTDVNFKQLLRLMEKT